MNALPAPLRGNELGTFTHRSVAERLPEIAARMLADNRFTPSATEAVRSIIEDISSGVIEPLGSEGPDQTQWASYVDPYLGLTWLDAPWFFVEFYFYRRLLGAVGYWDSGQDPFRSQKVLALDQALEPARAALAGLDADYARGMSTDILLIHVTDAALWGNQVDLSLWPAQDGGTVRSDTNEDRLLVDERPAAIGTLRDRHPPPIDIVLDNAGSELVADLVLADLLLRSDLASQVTLHAKLYPVFVSDATTADVAETIDHMAADGNAHVRSAGERLSAEVSVGRLITASDGFWVSPLEWRDRPDAIDDQLGKSGLIICKGDANYRRLLGDRHWDFSTPFADAIGSTPAPLLALRTLKSEVAAGLSDEVVARVEASDPEWLENGRWALASFSHG